MKCGVLHWRPTKGEGDVKMSAAFESADRITRLDALADWIADLQNLYEEILADRPTLRPLGRHGAP